MDYDDLGIAFNPLAYAICGAWLVLEVIVTAILIGVLS